MDELNEGSDFGILSLLYIDRKWNGMENRIKYIGDSEKYIII